MFMTLPQPTTKHPFPSPVKRFAWVLTVLTIPLLGVFWAQGLGHWWLHLALSPGDWSRWWTMLTSIWLHASLDHVVSNLFALTMLIWLATYTYPRTMVIAVPASVMGAGLSILLLGSSGSAGHIGASGVSYGLMAMFVTMMILRRTRMSAAIFMVVVFLFGAAWWGLLPIIPQVSWEGHLGGAIGGALSTMLFWRRDPVTQEERGILLEDTEGDQEDFPSEVSQPPVHSRPGVL